MKSSPQNSVANFLGRKIIIFPNFRTEIIWSSNYLLISFFANFYSFLTRISSLTSSHWHHLTSIFFANRWARSRWIHRQKSYALYKPRVTSSHQWISNWEIRAKTSVEGMCMWNSSRKKCLRIKDFRSLFAAAYRLTERKMKKEEKDRNKIRQKRPHWKWIEKESRLFQFGEHLQGLNYRNSRCEDLVRSSVIIQTFNKPRLAFFLLWVLD